MINQLPDPLNDTLKKPTPRSPDKSGQGMIKFKQAAYILRPLLILAVLRHPTVAETLSISEAIGRALAHNRDLVPAYTELEKARGRIVQAGLKPNPEIELSTTSDAAFSNEGERTLTLGVSQPIPLGRRLKKAEAARRLDLALILAEIRNRERLLIGTVQSLYVEVVAQWEQIALREKLLKAVNEFIAISQRRLAAAEVSPIDLTTLGIERDRLKLEKKLLLNDQLALQLQLKQALGLDSDTPLELIDTLTEIASTYSRRVFGGYGASPRPDQRIFELVADRAEAEISLAEAEKWGDLHIGLEYENEKAIFESPIGAEKDDFFGVSVAIPLPLRNRNQGRIQEQQATRKQARQQSSALELRISHEVALAYGRAKRFEAILREFEQQLLSAARKNLDAIKRAYSEGLVPISQVVQAQRQVLELEVAYLDILPNYILALIDWGTATATSPSLKRDYLASTTELIADLKKDI